MEILNTLVKLNGIYDIVCALSILKRIGPIPILSTLHTSMIINATEPILERFFAYWIFTYGSMQLSNNTQMIVISYFIEAVFIANETLIYHTIAIDKGLFVAIVSLFIAINHLKLVI